MDARRELAPTEPFPKDDGLPALSPDRSSSPATPPMGKSSPRNYGEAAHRLAHSSVGKLPSSEVDLLSSPGPLDTSGATMEASLPSTPRSKLQESPFARSPRTARVDADQTIQRLADYCSEMRALVNKAEMDLISVNVGGHGNGDAYHSLEGTEDKTTGTPDDGQPYRHGQIGAFRHFPRFDQASRPIVSDNWRAKSAAATVRRPPLVSLTTGSTSSPQSPLACTPIRSPLAAPVNPGVTSGFAQPNPNPPPTPVSLSTPITMAFGHAHHSSTSSLELGAPEGFSPRGTTAKDSTSMPRSSPSTDLITTRLRNLSLTNSSPITGNDSVSKNDKSTTFAVSLATDTLGYCFVRPNGTRTRLVPVDMLPYPLQGISADERENDRLVALPVPAGLGPDGRSSNVQVLKAVLPPGGNNGDAVQSQIDRILAAPSSQQHPLPSTTTTNTNAALTSPSQNSTSTQPTSQSTTNTPKRMKVYCDKWVHEGVCAFTQQGCKYKHEMPSDKATQHQLGLFLGYPVWWKRRQAELARIQTPTTTAMNGGTTGGSGGGGVNGAGDPRLGLGQGPGQGLGQGLGTAGSGGGLDRSKGVAAPGSGPGGRLLPGPANGNGMSGGFGGRLENSRFADANELGRSAQTSSVDVQGGNNSTLTRLPQSQTRQTTTNGGLGASRWGGNPITPSTNGNPVGQAREKLLGPSWRTPSSADQPSHRGYPDRSLQSYDGAASESFDRRELDRGSDVFLSNNGNINITPVTRFPGAASDTRAWPWDNPHYTRRASQTQQCRPQHHPGNVSAGFNAACTFAFPTTTPNATTSPSTSTSSVSMSSASPYGPIAPPLRNTTAHMTPNNTHHHHHHHHHQNGGNSNNNNNGSNITPTTTSAFTNGAGSGAAGVGAGTGYDLAPFPPRKGWN